MNSIGRASNGRMANQELRDKDENYKCIQFEDRVFVANIENLKIFLQHKKS
jgi:hypothetical protein